MPNKMVYVTADAVPLWKKATFIAGIEGYSLSELLSALLKEFVRVGGDMSEMNPIPPKTLPKDSWRFAWDPDEKVEVLDI